MNLVIGGRPCKTPAIRIKAGDLCLTRTVRTLA
jgi:hypothetical protein